MNGAEALLRTLVDCGVDVCFANPGTSEMHFVAALDAVPQLRAVLGLAEGVVTGAADGYARMSGRPAAALLHLGPGLANGLANLHNARRAHSPVLAVVGDHATTHQHLDAPLQSDLDALAGWLQGWVRRSAHPAEVGVDAAAAVAAAVGPPGRVATLILPADVSWSEVAGAGPPGSAAAGAAISPPAPTVVASDIVESVARVLASKEPAVLLVGGPATRRAGLVAAHRIALGAGARLLCETFPARLERGGLLPPVERLAYLADAVRPQLAGARHLILAGARPPVAFFAYPGQPGNQVPDGCTVHELAGPGDDVVGALEAVADLVGADAAVPSPDRSSEAPTGRLNLPSLGAALAALLPEGAIVSDEAITASAVLAAATERAAPHDWLTLTGGAIGQGMPVATGAAIACPDRPVVNLQADGSAMYTITALWTQAREGLDVTTVLLNNRSYAILGMELHRVGAAPPGSAARSLLDLSRPDLDFTGMAAGLGVPASRVETVEEFLPAFDRSLGEPGPHLIEVLL